MAKKKIKEDELIRFGDAYEYVTGHRVCLNTASRYRTKGIRGVRLKCERRQGVWYTSPQWVREFIVGVNAAIEQTRSPDGPKPKYLGNKKKDSKRASDGLARIGA